MSVNGIVKMFQRILDDETVVATSDFFELGGDSLLATRVLSAIMNEYDIELSLDIFYDAATPGDLYKRIEGETA